MKKPRKQFDGKLIDVHTHAEGIDFYNYTHNFTPTSMETVLLSQIVEKSKIDLAVTFPIQNTLYFNPNSYISNQDFLPTGIMRFPFEMENARLLDVIKCFGIENILPFLSFSLNDKVDEQVEFLESKIKNEFIYGLKYHPQCDRHNIGDLEMYPAIIRLLRRYNIPILIHSGKSRIANPIDVLRFAQKHPDIRVCIAHLGRFKKELFEEYFDEPLENLYFDMAPFDYLFSSANKDDAFLLGNDLENKLESISVLYEKLSHNLLWGTDFPWINSIAISNASPLDKMSYNSVVETLCELQFEIKKKIANENVLRFIYGESDEY